MSESFASFAASTPETSTPAPTIESTLDEATSIPEAKVAAPAAPEAIIEKKDAGEKLTKKEEKQLREYEIKVNGRTEKVKFDPTNDEEVKGWLQKGRASDSKFQEAAEVRKAALQFIDDLKKNPRRVLSDPNIGVDLKKFAEEIMNEQIAEMEKSPEQKRADDAERKLKDILEKQERDKQDFDTKEVARISAEHERNLESEISVALDVSGLPKTARTVKHMAEMMIIAMQHGVEITAQELSPIIKTTTLKEFKEVMNSLGDDQLEDFIGKEILARLRKKNVAKAKAVDTANAIKATSEPKKTVDSRLDGGKKMLIRDFLKA